MYLIHRYLTRAMLVPSGLAFAVVGFLVVANELEEQSHRFIAEVLTAWDLIVLGAAFLPSLMPVVLPVAFFFGILMSLGRLAEQGEITAMRATGVSLLQLTAPSACLGLIVTLLAFVAQDRLQPRTMAYAREFLRVELPRRATLDTLSPGVMHAMGEFRIYFAARDMRAHTLSEVTVVRHEEGQGAWVYQAERALVSGDESGPTLRLENVRFVSPEGIRGDVDAQLLRLAPIADAANPLRSRAEKSLRELFRDEKALTLSHAQSPTFAVQNDLRETRREIAERTSLPWAAFLFGCIGAPMAAESARFRRAGRQRLLGLGLILVFVYFFSHLLLGGGLAPLSTTLWLAWAPNLGLAALAAAALARAARVH